MTVTRVVRALMSWHSVTVGDMAGAVHMAKSTLERRFKEGGWTAREVAAFSWAFTVPHGVLYTGEVDLSASHWAGPPIDGPAPLQRRLRLPRLDSNQQPAGYPLPASARAAA